MIAYLPLHKINALYDAELREAVGRVLDSGWYLKGEATRQFECDYAMPTTCAARRLQPVMSGK